MTDRGPARRAAVALVDDQPSLELKCLAIPVAVDFRGERHVGLLLQTEHVLEGRLLFTAVERGRGVFRAAHDKRQFAASFHSLQQIGLFQCHGQRDHGRRHIVRRAAAEIDRVVAARAGCVAAGGPGLFNANHFHAVQQRERGLGDIEAALLGLLGAAAEYHVHQIPLGRQDRVAVADRHGRSSVTRLEQLGNVRSRAIQVKTRG